MLKSCDVVLVILTTIRLHWVSAFYEVIQYEQIDPLGKHKDE